MLSYRGVIKTYGAGILILALPIGLFLACGASAEGNFAGSGPGPDGGVADSSAGNQDSGTFIDGAGDSGAVPPPTTALFVQGSPSLSDVRLCWALDGTPAKVLPFPSSGTMPGGNFPGVPVGSVTPMDDASSLVGHTVSLYAIDALNFAQIEQGRAADGLPPSTCDALICGQSPNPTAPCLRYDLDYWPVADIPAGDLLANHDNVIALAGCTPNDPAATTGVCGASWTLASGNLHADVLQLTPANAAAGTITVQAAQLSPALASFAGDGGSVVVSFGAEDAGSAGVEVATLDGESALGAPVAVSIGTGLAVYGEMGFAVDVAGNDGSAGHLWMSLAQAQQLVDPTEDPTQFFGQTRTYLLAVLGEPDQAHFGITVAGDGGYDGVGLHVVVVAGPRVADGGADADVDSGATGDL